MMLSLLEADRVIPGPGSEGYKKKKESKKGHDILGDISKEFGGTLDMQKELDKLNITKLPVDKPKKDK